MARTAKTIADLKGIVGIGASAGGLEALFAFVANIPDKTGLCYVIVQHLAPDHPSIMDQLLAERTALPVSMIEAGMPAEPDKIFVLPPGSSLTISQGQFQLEPRNETPGVRTPIDKFFTSLAEQYNDQAACVILSGTGSDGTIGLRAIKSHGGIAIVQDSASARFSGMPDSASATGIVDLVLEPARMPRRIVDVMQRRHRLKHRGQGEPLREQIAARLPEIVALLAQEEGHDFADYKEGTLLRRIEKRMIILRLQSVAELVSALQDDKEERLRLLQDFLIGVTQFFRDIDVFETMADKIIPHIIDRNERDVRVWVPGCSTGEEAYSLAILFSQELRNRGDKRKLQVFGTDVDLGALRAARSGHFAPSAVENVSDALLERYFYKEDDEFVIKPSLRETVIFAPHNLLTDPPFSNLDLVSCRNLMIYLNQTAQRDALARFHYALKPKGCLLLGPSETLGDQEGYFEPVERKQRIFRRDSSQSMGYSAIAGTMEPARRGQAAKSSDYTKEVLLPVAAERSLDTVADQFFLSRFSPPYVVVDARDRVQYLSGNIGPFITPSKGQLTTELNNLLARELRGPMQTLLQNVRGNGAASQVRNIVVAVDGDTRVLDLEADFLPQDDERIMIAFLPVRLEAGADLTMISQTKAARVSTDMEQELELTRRSLSATRTDYEAAEQELRSANEELLSMNEELHSSNHELETSREELQSINEELETINAELTENNRKLATANGDLRNVMESTHIPTIILSDALRVRRFTRAARSLFSIEDRDVGRSILDLSWKIDYPEMADDVASVRATLQVVDREVTNPRTGHVYETRVRPYRGIDDRLDGCVITFVDVTERLKAARALALSEQRLKAALQAGRLGVYEFDPDTQELTWDDKSRELWGIGADSTVSLESAMSQIHPDDVDGVQSVLDAAVDPKGDGRFEIEYRIRKAGTDQTIWVRSEGQVSQTYDGTRRLVGTFRDITDQLAAEKELRDSKSRLETALRAGKLGVFEVDLKTNDVFWDDASRKMWGVPLDGDVNLEVAFAGVHPDDREEIENNFARMLAPDSEGNLHSVCRLVKAGTGEIVWIQSDAEVIREEGKPVRVLGTNKDVTEEQATARELRNSATRLALTYEVTGIAAYYWDVETHTNTWTSNMFSLIGCPDDRTPTLELFEEFIHPDDLPRVREALQEAMDTNDLFDEDFRIIRGDTGEERILAGKGRAIYDEKGAPVAMIGINYDRTDQVRDSAHRDLLTNELNHRVKNSLATIQSIARQTIITSQTLDDFEDRFLGRLQAIARAHDILVNDADAEASLAELINLQVGPYAVELDKQVSMNGPLLTLGPSVAHALGLVLHELATNAAKYGALRSDGGTISISWSEVDLDGMPGISLVWKEQGGPTVTEPTHRGFGSSLISSSLSLSLGGAAQIDYNPDGLLAQLTCYRRAEGE